MVGLRRLGAGALLLAAAGSCGIGGGGDAGGERLARALNLPQEVVSVCGDPRLLGVTLAPLGGTGSCGISDPVAVYAVGEVRLSQPAQLNCAAAGALKTWVETGAQPAARALGTRLTELTVAGSYACRRRNNMPNGALSEHAKGNAIDISGFAFADGERATVLGDWAKGRHSQTLQAMHKAACGPFGVVLGPRADRHHRDHFHFDVSHLSRRYCR